MKRCSGFTLIELLISVAVLALLIAVAYPSFSSFLIKSKRIEAIQTLYKMQLAQEEWRISHPSYTSSAVDLIGGSASAHYQFSAALSGAGYVLRAEAKSGSSQQQDKEGATSCSELTLTRDSDKAPAICWQ